MDDKIIEFEKIINEFIRYIKINIQRFNPQEDGIDPEDICQDVKIKIWKLIKDEKKINYFSSYLKKIINTTVIDQIRKLKKQESIIIQEKRNLIAQHKDYYRQNKVNYSHLNISIDNALESLIESRKKVVKLFLLNMSIDEISIFLHWSKDKTRNLLYRGLADLKAYLKEEGIEYDNK